eukprot:NODE_3332_length_800_cov_127.044295.p2 GENE.NODE_3332_length_800_cov_127.044295~~NODE_3332_length_800_cov_127.044295.p2  ORF type:complete len:173 (-),score=34.34 NODE_3332_length_800_cov_127.044295:143-661(-)
MALGCCGCSGDDRTEILMPRSAVVGDAELQTLPDDGDVEILTPRRLRSLVGAMRRNTELVKSEQAQAQSSGKESAEKSMHQFLHDEYVVKLRKSGPDKAVGLLLASSDGTGWLMVTGVKDGLVSQWNEQNAAHVRAGDVVLEVNGTRQHQEMLGSIQRDAALRIVFARCRVL